jgi:hypothetical protein
MKRVRGKTKMLVAAGIPANRPYVYEKPFFREGLPVAQGIRFPLTRNRYSSGKVKLGQQAKGFGVTAKGIDARNISYVDGSR